MLLFVEKLQQSFFPEGDDENNRISAKKKPIEPPKERQTKRRSDEYGDTFFSFTALPLPSWVFKLPHVCESPGAREFVAVHSLVHLSSAYLHARCVLGGSCVCVRVLACVGAACACVFLLARELRVRASSCLRGSSVRARVLACARAACACVVLLARELRVRASSCLHGSCMCVRLLACARVACACVRVLACAGAACACVRRFARVGAACAYPRA